MSADSTDDKAIKDASKKHDRGNDDEKTGTYVIAVDFGTTRSGVAYVLEERPDEIIVKQTEKPKELTAVLVKLNGEFIAYGEAAQKRYLNMDPEEQQKVMYFETFKMFLYGIKGHVRPMLKDASGKEMSCVTVIAAVLGYFKSKALAQIQDGLMKDLLRQFAVRYVVTIPAIWDDGAKQLMREAAVLAGLAKNMNDRNFTLALESEAASLTCYSVARKQAGFVWQPDTRYLVTDLGGGTSDYTVHKITEKQSLGQVIPSSGGAMGSHYINQKMLAYFEELFGIALMQEFRVKHTSDWVEFLGDIERSKTTVAFGDDGIEPQTQRIPAPLLLLLEQKAAGVGIDPKLYVDVLCMNFNKNKHDDDAKKLDAKFDAKNDSAQANNKQANKQLSSTDDWELLPLAEKVKHENEPKAAAGAGMGAAATAANANANSGAGASTQPEKLKAKPYIQHRNGRLRLLKPFLESAFRDVVNANVAELECIVSVTKLNYVFMVGGFARSEVVQRAFRTVLEKKNIRLIIPSQVDQAVLLGAARFGLNPKIILSRVMQYNYGVETAPNYTHEHKRDGRSPKLFQRTERDETRHVMLCPGVFLPIAHAGAEMITEQEVHKTFNPASDDMTSATICLYRSKATVKYIDDAEAKYVGCLKVEMPNTDGGVKRHIKATFFFGATELRVVAIDVTTGVEFKTSISFFDD